MTDSDDTAESNEVKKMLAAAADTMNESSDLDDYASRHGVQAAPYLTVTDDETAHMLASHLDDRIAGKTVVEIGGGLGLLSLHLAFRAKRVFCIEANPIWASSFVAALLERKPKNVSYLFGAADEFVGLIRADVAIFCTHSGVASMRLVSQKFAPVVIDVWGEIIASNPEKFDETARRLRQST